MNKPQTVRQRLIALMLLPVLLSLITSGWLINSVIHDQLTEQSAQFGQLISHQMANTAVDYLANDDVLSLNVMLETLTEQHHLGFVAIYDHENGLIAQSGKRKKGTPGFNSEINFQDANLGYVLLELDEGTISTRLTFLLLVTAAVHAALGLIISTAIWFYGDLIYLGVLGKRSSKNNKEEPDQLPPPVEEPSDLITMITLKITPARLIPLAAIEQAVLLYRGKLERGTEEEFHVEFAARNQIEQALCCATVLAELLRLVPHRLHFKIAIEQANDDNAVTLKKEVRYLASLSDQNCLVSRKLKPQLSETQLERFGVHQFHSAITGDSELYALESKELLFQQQANQLFDSR